MPFLNRTLEFAELNPNPDFYEFERQKEKDVVFGAGDGQVGLCTLGWYALTCSLTIV